MPTVDNMAELKTIRHIDNSVESNQSNNVDGGVDNKAYSRDFDSVTTTTMKSSDGNIYKAEDKVRILYFKL